MPDSRWREDQLAYDGSSADPVRELTPRERDILSRVLHSLVYPFTQFGWDTPRSAESRDAILRYTRAQVDEGDLLILARIRDVVSPREYDRDEAFAKEVP